MDLINKAISQLDRLEQEKKMTILQNYPLISHNQTALWFEMEINPTSNAYNLGVIWELNGTDIDMSEVKSAILKVVDNNRILRSVHYEHSEKIFLLSLSSSLCTVEDKWFNSEAEMTQHLQEIYATPFDLRKEFPARFHLCNTGEKSFLTCFFHHIVMDGVSLSSFKNQLTRYINEPHHRFTSIDFFDYLFSINAQEENSQCADLWEDYYSDYTSEWLTFEDPGKPECDGAQIIQSTFGSYIELINFSKKHSLQLFTLLHYALARVVYKLSGEEAFFIGTTEQNRPIPDVQETIGYFARTIKLRTQYQQGEIKEDLNAFETLNLKALALPALTLSEVLRHTKNVNIMQPYQIVLELQRIGSEQNALLKQSNLSQQCFKRSAKNDISVFFFINDNEAKISLEYDSDKYSAQFARLFLDTYLSSLDVMLGKPDKRIPAFVSGKKRDRYALLEEFSKHACLFPQKSAFLNRGHLTYAELHKTVNEQSRFIHQNYSESEPVVILAKREPDTLISLYAAWFAGRKVLLLPPDLPCERARFMCEELETQKILSVSGNPEQTTLSGFPVLQVNNEIQGEFLQGLDLHDNTYGYYIFSSGSTGRPKGVDIGRVSIENLAAFLDECYTGISRCALNADFSFDASYQNILMPLLGRAVYILNQEERLDPHKMVNALREKKIQSMDCTPSQLRAFFDANIFDTLPDLKMLIVGGEKIDETLLQEIIQHPQIQFINVYGPCECTVDVTYSTIDAKSAEGLIGYPIPNTAIGIYTRKQELCETGEHGEIVVLGDAVSNGYVGKTANNTNFRTWMTPTGLAWGYATGDVGYIDTHENIWLKGRSDQQIKLNGVRIELGEINSVALKFESIGQAHAFFESERGQIILYCSPKSGMQKPQDNAITEFMKQHLPAYMLPGKIVVRQSLPLTVSGKLDINSLKMLLPTDHDLTPSHFPPALAELSSLIKKATTLEIVDPEANILNIGLDSLKIFRTIKAIKEHYGTVISIGDIIQNPTLNQLATFIAERNTRSDDTSVGNHLVLLNSGREHCNKTIILFPAVGGTLDCYHSLIANLNNDVHLYGVEEDFNQLTRHVKSFEQLCHVYAQKIISNNLRTVDLIGWSYGGLVAFEVARILTDHDIEIGTVTLIDTIYDGAMTLDDHENERTLKSVIGSLTGSTPLSVPQPFIPSEGVYADIAEELRFHYRIQVTGKDLSELVDKVSWHRALLAKHLFTQTPCPDFDISTIWAEESYASMTGECIRWNDLNGKDSQVRILPGNHYSVIRHPDLTSHIERAHVVKAFSS